jgi:hypothetical protein
MKNDTVFIELKAEIETIFGNVHDDQVYPLDMFRKQFPEFLKFYQSLSGVNVFYAIAMYLDFLDKQPKQKFRIVKFIHEKVPSELNFFLVGLLAGIAASTDRKLKKINNKYT